MTGAARARTLAPDWRNAVSWMCAVWPARTLPRNLLYTAITRAKKLAVLVGTPRAISAAVRTASTGQRHTGLSHRLTPG